MLIWMVSHRINVNKPRYPGENRLQMVIKISEGKFILRSKSAVNVHNSIYFIVSCKIYHKRCIGVYLSSSCIPTLITTVKNAFPFIFL